MKYRCCLIAILASRLYAGEIVVPAVNNLPEGGELYAVRTPEGPAVRGSRAEIMLLFDVRKPEPGVWYEVVLRGSDGVFDVSVEGKDACAVGRAALPAKPGYTDVRAGVVSFKEAGWHKLILRARPFPWGGYHFGTLLSAAIRPLTEPLLTISVPDRVVQGEEFKATVGLTCPEGYPLPATLQWRKTYPGEPATATVQVDELREEVVIQARAEKAPVERPMFEASFGRWKAVRHFDVVALWSAAPALRSGTELPYPEEGKECTPVVTIYANGDQPIQYQGKLVVAVDGKQIAEETLAGTTEPPKPAEPQKPFELEGKPLSLPPGKGVLKLVPANSWDPASEATAEIVVVDRTAAQRLHAKPRYECLRTVEAIRIDGKLNEYSWQKAPATEAFWEARGLWPAKTQTVVKVLWDDENLYLGATTSEDDLVATHKRRDDPLYGEDVIEVFVDPTAKADSYVELEVSPRATLFDNFFLHPWKSVGPANYNIAGMKAGSSRSRNAWTVEMLVPLRGLHWEMPTDKTVWHINFYRINHYHNDPYRQRAEFSAWSSPHFINFHRPERFGELVFSNKLAWVPWAEGRGESGSEAEAQKTQAGKEP